jgi:ParB family chromosome partitioning protein
VKKTLETKPQLIQISAAWNSREGAPLGRNHYVELEIKKAKPNGASSKLSPVQKPCDKMTEAIVMDGGKRGQVVKVCADPACRVHHPNTPSPQQVERERAEERKRIEKEKLAITTRHRVLATILQRVSAPLKKVDLLAVAHYLIGHLSYSGTTELRGVRMDDQSAILDATACTQVCPVAHQDHIHRLLPWRFRREMDRPLLATVHKGKQPVCQARMKDIL